MESWPRSEADLLTPPTDPVENLRWRAQLTMLWRNHPQTIPNLLSLSAKNLRWTFAALFWTKDPRRSPSERPFTLYPHEQDLLTQLDDHLVRGKDLLIEKTRDMGASWTILGWLLWHWRFDGSFNAILGSRLEDLIDEKGNLDTHFERLRWLCRNLPAWWLPHQFDDARHLSMAFSESKHIPYMRLIRPDTDNTIVGEAVTEDFSRQGRYNLAFIDEMSACEHAEGAWTATADSAPMRLAVSTPKGLGNKFAQLRRSGQVDVMTLHWSQHPEKAKGLTCQTHIPLTATCRFPECALTSPWYEGEKSRRSHLEIAQELDINYLGSGSPYFDQPALTHQVIRVPIAKGRLVELDQRIEFRPEDASGLWLYALPLPETTAVIGADPSEGIGRDRSGAVVLDTKTLNTLAVYSGQISPEDFAVLLMCLGRWYNHAWIEVESNGLGLAVVQDLTRLYARVVTERDERALLPTMKPRPGVRITSRNRDLLLNQFAEELREGATDLVDGRLLDECRTFEINEAGRPEAASGFHDDLVFARVHAGWARHALRLIPKISGGDYAASRRHAVSTRRRGEQAPARHGATSVF